MTVNLLKRKCEFCDCKELDVLGAISSLQFDLKNEKIILSGQTITKCIKCNKQNLFLRNKAERESVKDFINVDVCKLIIKKMSQSMIYQLEKK